MIIQQKKGNINPVDTSNKNIDWLSLQWFETNKRILHKKTNAGTEISLKWLGETNKGEIQFIFHMNGSGMGKIIRVYYYIDNDKIVFTKDTYEHELLSHNKRVIVN